MKRFCILISLFLICGFSSTAQYSVDSMLQAEDSINTVKFNDASNKWGIGITSSGFKESDFGTVSLNLEIVNTASKTVKYVYLTVKIYNPVNDLIAVKNITCVGPIAYFNNKDYTFDNLFYTKQFGSGTITKMKIQYTDGSFKEIPANVISLIIL
jgi:hypothetical protein